VHTSNEAAYAITCSEDSTGRIYDIASGDLLIQIDKMESNLIKKDQVLLAQRELFNFKGANFLCQQPFFHWRIETCSLLLQRQILFPYLQKHTLHV
jgi:hypothetical protein